jgi:hypothetical protein
MEVSSQDDSLSGRIKTLVSRLKLSLACEATAAKLERKGKKC